MSCCASKDEGSAAIERELARDGKVFKKTVKILLLGAGQTGKTTFMKQIQHLYAEGFDKDKLRHFRSIILLNIYDFADQMLQEMSQLGACQSEVSALRPVLDGVDRSAEFMDKAFGEALLRFWKSNAVQAFHKESLAWFQNDSCKYYFDRLSTIMKGNYEPSSEDVFRARVKTTGIYELKFQMVDSGKRVHNFVITDVGGQRSERSKWIHCFENVMAVIFFVDLSGFNLTLDEAPTCNRMDESLKLFDAICNSQWFKNTYMILFFNKTDLFAEKLASIKLKSYMPTYHGDNSFESAASFIKDEFLKLNKAGPHKPVYHYFTCATDTKNMKFVFNTISDAILRNSLKDAGLI